MMSMLNYFHVFIDLYAYPYLRILELGHPEISLLPLNNLSYFLSYLMCHSNMHAEGKQNFED